MEKSTIEKRQSIPLAFRAEEALKKAVADAIAEHKRAGVPIVIWRDGKVVKVHAAQIAVKESETEYKTLNGKSTSHEDPNHSGPD